MMGWSARACTCTRPDPRGQLFLVEHELPMRWPTGSVTVNRATQIVVNRHRFDTELLQVSG